MRYLLDTCALSDYTRKHPDPGLAAWLEAAEESELYLSVISVGEIEKGIRKLPGSRRRSALLHWLKEDLLPRFGRRMLLVGPEVARAWGALQGSAEKDGRPVPVVDSLLAATAAVHDCTVVTRNVDDFERCGATVLCPWGSR